MMMTKTRLLQWFMCALSVAVFTAPRADAVVVRFDIDPASSSLALAGSFGAIPLFPQAPGADVTSYSGSILVDLDDTLAPTSIAFVAGESAVAAINGVWLPNDVLGCGPGENCEGDDPNVILGDADPGFPAPGNYGLGVILTSADLGLPPGLGEAVAVGALRDVTLTLTSGPTAVVGGAFASTQSLTLDSGIFDTNLSSTLPTITTIEDSAGTSDLSGDTADGPNGASDGTYSVSGDIATLTIPMEFLFGGDVTLGMGGVLVATRVVPEPSSLLLLTVAGCLFAGWTGRRRTRE
ncbi:MAG: PEP-CTERM sorting domain-containing protein [Pirellulales bacterium]